MFIELLRKQIAALTETRDAALARMDEIAATITTETRSEASDEEAIELTSLEETARSASDEIREKSAKLAELVEIANAQTPTVEVEVPAAARSTRSARGDDPYDIELRSAARTPEVRRDIADRAMRALEASELTDEQRSHVDNLLRNRQINQNGALERHLLTTGRPAYQSAFAKFMRGDSHFTAEESAAIDEMRAITIGTDSQGGFLMPFTLDPTIVLINDGRTNPMRQLATVQTVATDNWHGVTTSGITASWDGELEEVSDDSPEFAQPEIKVVSARAFVPFSVEAEDDFNGLMTDAMTLIADSIDELEATGFATGTGSANKQPEGIVTGLVAASSTVTTASAGALDLPDLDAISDAIPDRYDTDASWLLNRGIVSVVRGLATGNDPVSFITNGDVPTLLDRPRYKYSALSGTVATGEKIAVLGDIRKAYRINDRLGLTVERVQHLFGANGRPTGSRGFFARKRVGAGVVNASAARVLVVG